MGKETTDFRRMNAKKKRSVYADEVAGGKYSIVYLAKKVCAFYEK